MAQVATDQRGGLGSVGHDHLHVLALPVALPSGNDERALLVAVLDHAEDLTGFAVHEDGHVAVPAMQRRLVDEQHPAPAPLAVVLDDLSPGPARAVTVPHAARGESRPPGWSSPWRRRPAGRRGARSGDLRSRGAPRCGARRSARTRSDGFVRGASSPAPAGQVPDPHGLVSWTLAVFNPPNGHRALELVGSTTMTRRSRSSTPISSTRISRSCRRIAYCGLPRGPFLIGCVINLRGWRGYVGSWWMLGVVCSVGSRAQFPRLHAVSIEGPVGFPGAPERQRLLVVPRKTYPN